MESIGETPAGRQNRTMRMEARLAMLLLAVSFAVTLVIVLNSRRWVHQAVPR